MPRLLKAKKIASTLLCLSFQLSRQCMFLLPNLYQSLEERPIEANLLCLDKGRQIGCSPLTCSNLSVRSMFFNSFLEISTYGINRIFVNLP